MLGVLRRDAQLGDRDGLALRLFIPADAQPAPPQPEIEHFIQRQIRLHQRILARNAEVGDSMLDIGRHVAGLDEDEAVAASLVVKDQLAAPVF